LITNGGDYVPLVPFSLYNVTFNETGLPLGTLWGVATSLSNVSSTGTNLTIESPNGTLPFTVVLSSGEPYYSVSPTSFSVSGADVVVNLTFLPLLTYTFDEAGLYLGILGDWQVTLVGNGTGGIPDEVVSTSTSIGFSDLEPGTYSFSTTSTGYYALPSNGTIAVNATFPDTTKIEFTPVPFATFTETGLPGNTPWNVSLLPPTPGAPIVLTSNSSTIVAYIFDFPDLLSLPGGLANFSAASYDYNATPPSGQFTPGPGTVVPIAFTAFPGIIDLTIGPVCSQVEVDGTIIETSACSATLSVAPGVHELEVSAPGFQTYFNNVSVPAGGSVDLVVSLQSVPSTAAGAVNLTIAPVCAQVTLDGVLTQASTCGSVTIPLPAGIHQLEVSASGYLAYYTNMSIPAGQTVDLNVTLERVPSSSTSSAGVGTQGWELIALLVVIIVVLLAIALILYSRRRQPARPLTPAGATPSTPPISEEPSMVATTSGPSASVPPPVLAEWDESSPLENPPGPPGSGSP
jgi:hypothetical protein